MPGYFDKAAECSVTIIGEIFIPSLSGCQIYKDSFMELDNMNKIFIITD